jgi:hypothetical protein
MSDATTKRPSQGRRRAQGQRLYRSSRRNARGTPSPAKGRAPANDDRARRALAALNAYVETSDHDDEPEIYTDLLADLGHLCDQEGIDFQHLVDIALVHWRTERDEVHS